jgi:hypothetical protein
MGDHRDPDELIVAELRAFLADADPVPPLVVETAKASLGWRRLDADLAELLSDSALIEEPLALTRGAEAPARAVTFSTTGLTIDIEVHADDDGRTLLGQLSPPLAGTIEVQTAAETTVSTDTDRLGRFRVRLPAPGRIRLRVLGAGADARAPVETSWITV